jgi:hypothetical protein
LVTEAVVVPPAGTLTLLTTVVGATWTYWPASGAAAAGAMGRARVATAARRARPAASARRRERVPGAPGRGWTGVWMRRSSPLGGRFGGIGQPAVNLPDGTSGPGTQFANASLVASRP